MVSRLIWASILLCGLPLYGSTLYLTDSSKEFGTLDTTTGVFTPITTLQTSLLYGMGFTSGGTLYGTGSNSPATVYQINEANGALTSVGTASSSAGGSTVLTTDGLIYAVSQSSNSSFYSFDPTLLTSTTISAGLGFQSDGLAVFDGGQFYTDRFVSSGHDTLERIDPSTGIPTAVGTGLGFNIYAGALAGTTLYGVGPGGGTPALYTIDTTTGVATKVSNITGMALGAAPYSLAFDNGPANSSVPEPSTVSLAALSLVAGLVLSRRRSRRPAGDSTERRDRRILPAS